MQLYTHTHTHLYATANKWTWKNCASNPSETGRKKRLSGAKGYTATMQYTTLYVYLREINDETIMHFYVKSSYLRLVVHAFVFNGTFTLEIVKKELVWSLKRAPRVETAAVKTYTITLPLKTVFFFFLLLIILRSSPYKRLTSIPADPVNMILLYNIIRLKEIGRLAGARVIRVREARAFTAAAPQYYNSYVIIIYRQILKVVFFSPL